MPRNGSGLYKLPPGINPVVPNTVISSSWANTTLNDMAAALTNSVASDGQTPMTANLPMGGNRVTGMADPVDPQDAVTLGFLDTKSFDRIGISGWSRPESGSFASVTKSGDYSVFVPAGTGIVIDPVDGSKQVTWGSQDVVLTGVASSWSTTIAIDAFGNVSQLSGQQDPSWARQYIILAEVCHVSGVINSVVNSPLILGGAPYAMYDVASFLAHTVIEGGKVHAASLDGLGVAIDSKTAFLYGGAPNQPRNPNVVSYPPQDGISMFMCTGVGVSSPAVSSIPVGKYDPDGAGSIVDIPGASSVASVFRLYQLNGTYIMMYGQKWYDTLADALINMWSEGEVIPAKLAGAVLVAAIAVTKGATNIDNPSQASITSNPGSGSGGQSSPVIVGGGPGIGYRSLVFVNANTVIDRTYAGSMIVVDSPSDVTITIRDNDGDPSLDWQDADCLSILCVNTGMAVLAAGPSGLISPPSGFTNKTRSSGSTISITCVAADTNQWSSSGDLFRPVSNTSIESFILRDQTALYGTLSSVGTGKCKTIFPYNFVLLPIAEGGAFASLATPQSSGPAFTVDVTVNGVSIFSSRMMINNGDKSSKTSSIPASYTTLFEASGRVIPAGSEVSVDITQIGSASASGASACLVGQRG